MIPLYRHYLSYCDDINCYPYHEVFPIYGDDFAKETNREQNQQFFRDKLSSSITFKGNDFDFIKDCPFEVYFEYWIDYHPTGMESVFNYFRGTFKKTDCKFNFDNKTVEVAVEVRDNYNKTIDGCDKEFDLIGINPSMTNCGIRIRPIVQLYIPGSTTITNLQGGKAWEQSCESITDENALINKYHFYKSSDTTNSDIIVTGSSDMSPDVAGVYKKYSSNIWRREDNLYQIVYPTNGFVNLQIVSNGVYLFQGYSRIWPPKVPITMTARGASVQYQPKGTLICTPLSILSTTYTRYLLGTSASRNLTIYPIAKDDLVSAENPNYRYIAPFTQNDTYGYTVLNTITSIEPTEWGLAPNGRYYTKPNYPSGGSDWIPVARSSWAGASMWFAFLFGEFSELYYSQPIILNSSYGIADAIQSLLNQIGGVTHQATPEYSQFLYGESIDGLKTRETRLILMQKSNVLRALHSNDATKAPIRLKEILDMLQNCYDLYWFIDDNYRLIIEHITYFQKGGTYFGGLSVSHDITTMKNLRNGQMQGYGQNQIQYNKELLYSQKEFKYMDDCSDKFTGLPITISSIYADSAKTESVNVSKFTPDIDMMLGNPNEFSKDGFAIIEAIHEDIRDATLTGEYGQAGYINTSGSFIQGSNGWWYYHNNCFPNETYTIIDINGNQLNGVYWHFFAKDGTSIGRQDITDGKITTTNEVYEIGVSIKISSSAIPADSNLPVISISNIKAILASGWSAPIESIDNPILGNTDRNISYENRLQNGMMAWPYLQFHYMQDNLPARAAMINGIAVTARNIEKNKIQEVKFPSNYDINPFSLIKTYIGNGQPDKISVTLGSRSVKTTLKFYTDDK